MPKNILSFEDAYRAYLNCGDAHTSAASLMLCIKAATTFEEARQAYHACMDNRNETIHLRTDAIGCMIRLSTTVEQAEQALVFSKPKNRRCKGYPKREEEAQERIRQLQSEPEPA